MCTFFDEIAPGEHLGSASVAPDEALPGPPTINCRPHHKVPAQTIDVQPLGRCRQTVPSMCPSIFSNMSCNHTDHYADARED